MIIAVFIIFVFIAIFLCRNVKNQYSWILSILMLSFNVITISLVLYINKLSDYRSLIQLDNELYYRIINFKISFFTLRSMINAGVILFVFGKLNVLYISRPDKTAVKLLYSAVSVAVCLAYYYLNSFDFAKQLHIGAVSFFGVSADKIRDWVWLYDCLLLGCSVLLPYIWLYLRSRQTKIKFKKKQYQILAVAFGIIDIFFIVLFVIGPFRGMVLSRIDLISYTNYHPEHSIYFYTYFPLTVFGMLNIIFFLLVKYRIFDTANLFRRKKIAKSITYMPQDIRHIMHSYKNAFFSIKTLTDKAMALLPKDGTEHAEESGILLKEIEKISEEYIKRSGDFSNISRNIVSNLTELNVPDFVVKVCGQKDLAGIRLELNVMEEECYIFGDERQLAEVIKNMLDNSVEAIAAAEREDGRIVISVFPDDDWICVSIWDNGCGITAKNKRKLFKPLFSTKKTNDNWGIGLSYVNKVIYSHFGMIFVESEPGEFAEFQILLPSSRGRQYY